MSEVAREMSVPLVDLHQKTYEFIVSKGDEYSKKYFMWLEPNVYDGYINGAKDDTHLSKLGALEISKMVIDSIKELNLDISKFIK